MQMRLGPGRLLRLPALAVLALASCAPSIERFAADPRVVATGDATTLSWGVTGTAVLTAEPALDGLGAVDSAGERVVRPERTTVFTLTATRGGSTAFARQEVEVLTGGERLPLVLRTAPDGAAGLLARQELSTVDWGTGDLALVYNDSDRAIDVAHAGTTAAIARGSSSDAWRGQPIAGLWELRAALLPGEAIGDPQHAPPDRLRLRLLPAAPPPAR